MPALIQRQRTKGWRKPKGAVYIGRGSKWGNPFVEDKTLNVEQLVLCYQIYLTIETNAGRLDPSELDGATLMCWCGDWEPGEPEIPCHGVALLKAANEI